MALHESGMVITNTCMCWTMSYISWLILSEKYWVHFGILIFPNQTFAPYGITVCRIPIFRTQRLLRKGYTSFPELYKRIINFGLLFIMVRSQARGLEKYYTEDIGK